MFDVVLGTKIIHTTDDKNIIGTVHLDTISETIKIDFPLGIRSKSIDNTDSREIFKLEMYTLSEFTGKKSSIIINSSKWVDIIEPKEDILNEYMRISKNLNQDISMGSEFRGIDMDKIMGDYQGDPDDPRENFRELSREDIPTHIVDSIDKFFSNIINDRSKNMKKPDKIRDRWVDKL